MANLIVTKLFEDCNEKIEEIFEEIKNDIYNKDTLLYKKLKEDEHIEDGIIKKIKENNVENIEELETKFKKEIKAHMFRYSKNTISQLFTYVTEKEQENRIKSHIEISNKINELEEDSFNLDNFKGITDDLISSITSDSSVFKTNTEMDTDYFNVWNSVLGNLNDSDNNSDNDSNNENNSDNDSDNISNEEMKIQLDSMNMLQLREIAKHHDIVLSKKSDEGTTRKKNKMELIEELVLVIRD